MIVLTSQIQGQTQDHRAIEVGIHRKLVLDLSTGIDPVAPKRSWPQECSSADNLKTLLGDDHRHGLGEFRNQARYHATTKKAVFDISRF